MSDVGARAAVFGDARYRLPAFGRAGPNAKRVAGFRKGLSNAGLVEGKNVAIEFRWAEGKNEKLAELAEELIAKRVAVIVTLSSTVAAVAAKKVTSTVPILFSGCRPAGRAGPRHESQPPRRQRHRHHHARRRSFGQAGSQLLRELVPQSTSMAALLQPNHPSTKAVIASLEATARTLGVQLDAQGSRQRWRDRGGVSFDQARRAASDRHRSVLSVRRAQLATLSAKHGVPTIYDSRESAEAGGLMSYGPNHVRLWEQGGGTVARILKGEKPADLPVVQAAIFETIINMKAAKALGLAIPDKLMALADEVME